METYKQADVRADTEVSRRRRYLTRQGTGCRTSPEHALTSLSNLTCGPLTYLMINRAFFLSTCVRSRGAGNLYIRGRAGKASCRRQHSECSHGSSDATNGNLYQRVDAFEAYGCHKSLFDPSPQHAEGGRKLHCSQSIPRIHTTLSGTRGLPTSPQSMSTTSNQYWGRNLQSLTASAKTLQTISSRTTEIG